MLRSWQKIGEAKVLAKKFGKWFVSQAFRTPDGRKEEYVLFGQNDWSMVLALTEDRQVVAVRQYKQGCDKVITELPAGTADFADETPEAVMRRELLEETGYEPREVHYLGAYWIASRSSSTRFHSFLATGCRKIAEAKLDHNEEIETELVPASEWVRQVLVEGVIDESASVVTTARALPYLKR